MAIKSKLLNILMVYSICYSCCYQQDHRGISTVVDYQGLDALKQVQQQMIDSNKVGSNQVVIYKDGQEIYNHISNSGHSGDANITSKTIFPLWSMTKPITTVAAMILFEQGKFMMDDPISKFLPEMIDLECLDSVGNRYPCKNPVTMLDILAHQSGWGYYPMEIDNKFLLISDTLYRDLRDFSEAVSKIPLEFEPGTRYLYGVNTSVLGRVIEVISQQSLYDFMKENIFEPLQMTDTKFFLTPEDRKYFQPLHQREQQQSSYYREQFDELSYSAGSQVLLGGAGLVSTTKDYGHFCEMLLNGGYFRGNKIVSQLSIDWMRQPLNPELESGTFIGCSTGFSFFNLTNPVKSGALSPRGIFGWGGYHGTLFWIDLENNLYGLVMDRTDYSSQEMFRRVRTATYQVLELEPQF